ncbi:MerR family transcriptional regulator (plasmid) [Paenibacillus rhizovicinus]|uniref:MerR family transcriptional regulator n=1 Tax=Paenibacillus rhizovicinus TaxID=2704463 RepID=A0A6C0PB32_9BACL|nr:MerR family transcriptional regulator [Paenibacillus rhizovicinus]QHW35728.1 MerR family transcriptional regulator [Paenibacillus rhizovicinus]
MAIQREVPFVTLGDASEILGTPQPTLRGWADMLENHGVHFVKRNERKERLFYDTDIEIFKFIKDQKEVHGRKTTGEDLARMIYDMANETGAFELRKPDGEFPLPIPAPQLTYVDMDRLMQQDAFREWFVALNQEMNKETLEKIDSLEKQVVLAKQEQIQKIETLEQQLAHSKNEQAVKIDKIIEHQEKRDRETMAHLKQSLALRQYMALPAWKRMFKSPPEMDAQE